MWKSGNEWKEISSQQMYGRVRALVGQLQQWGIKRGERVGLVSENRWEWPVVDFAVLAIGGVDVPLYDTLTPEQMGYILRDAGVRAVIVSNKCSTRSWWRRERFLRWSLWACWMRASLRARRVWRQVFKGAPELEGD